MEQKIGQNELHCLTENEAEILAELFRYGVARKLEIAIKDSTPNAVTAALNLYICHRQDIFSHRLKAPKFSGYDATAGIFIPTKQCAEIFTLARYAGLRLEECFRIDTNDAQKALETGKLFVKGKGGLTRYVPINESIEITFRKLLEITPRGQKLFVSPNDKTHLAMKRLQCFISYHRKAFTEKRITFHGLRHTYAHEKYDEYINKGYSEYQSRKKVSELLGHHRDEVTNIYLSGGDDYA